ncbi:class I SAM-dependent methyltransferase [Paenibacillus xerothermodurans]|uniref:Class I SAM-dependent methyltransferase n=1 Tax=Paenibacillus xerothermodurans TaxID=1977292 RepID=A0A2W1NXR2_PAEXE|nr:class I SAM-dependent methyltransferase [Paenibacillus xerothermodurans]PZE19668.1 class I SAM-dependent methyltransferase [Paenibacillus xerothermodurans]
MVSPIISHAAPRLYHWFVRPRWVTKKYIHNHVQSHFDLNDKHVLDFGSGTGANSPMVNPLFYIGVDPDAARVNYAKSLYPGHNFRVLKDSRLPVDNGMIDYILIIAVLHHISSDEIAQYMKEFTRVLKPTGMIIVMEPHLNDKNPVCNRFMQWYDKGDFIRHEQDYLRLFEEHDYECSVLKRFKKCFLYNELFFAARPKHKT